MTPAPKLNLAATRTRGEPLRQLPRAQPHAECQETGGGSSQRLPMGPSAAAPQPAGAKVGAMQLLKTHAPPAFAADLENVPDGLASWNEFMAACFQEAIDDLQRSLASTDGGPGVPQFFDARQPFYCGLEGLIEAPIVWNAFPRVLALELGRPDALLQADDLWREDPQFLQDKVLPTGWMPDRTDAPFYFRPQDEYCEWRVERDGATGKIRRVTFTCEPPEYWTALYGGQVRYGRDAKVFEFRGNPDYATTDRKSVV